MRKNNKQNEHEYYNEVYEIPIDLIAPNPLQPRKYFDGIKLNELAKTIEEYGVLEPILVRKVGTEYEIITGERRLRGAILAGLEKIPAIIIDVERDKCAILSLLENLQREDLCFFEIAESYKNLLHDQGITQVELARRVGKSQSTIANKMRLLKLSPRVKKLIRDYNLTERHARSILALPNEQSQIAVIRRTHSEQLNVSDTEKLVEDIILNKPEMQKATLRPARLKDVRLFTNTIRRAVDIMKKSGIETVLEKEECDWGVEYIIKVVQNPEK